MSPTRISTVIAAPVEDVFRLYSDPGRRSEWNPAARGVIEQTGPPNQPGTRYVIDTRFGPFEVRTLRIEPPNLIEQLEGVGRTGEAHVTIRFDPLPSGDTRLVAEHTVAPSGRLGRISAPLMAFMARIYGQIELRRFKRLAERASKQAG